MNKENEWDHKKSAGVKEGPADCIEIAEVTVVVSTFKFCKWAHVNNVVHGLSLTTISGFRKVIEQDPICAS